MENLNKENFWNEMTRKHPLAMKDFCKWVDEYKKKNNWDTLFNGEISKTHYSENEERWVVTGITKSPKYHDLPLAMQMGLWMEYMAIHSSETFTAKFVRENVEEDLGNINMILELKNK